jgi:spore maturation protein CgeB
MKFVIFGLTVSSSWGNGHATLWRGLIRALSAEGHLVVFFERDVPYYANARDLAELPGKNRLVLYPSWDEIRPRARADLEDADVAIVTSYCPDALGAEELLQHTRGLRVFYDLDTPVTLAQIRDGTRPAYIGPQGLVPYDLVFSYTGGKALTALREELGARSVAPLYGHVDPVRHKPAAPVERYRCDLSYLGTFADDRQSALQRLFVAAAMARPNRTFLIGGANYPQDFPWTENIYFARHLPPGEHPAFFSSSRLTLNVTRKSMADMGWCPSGRLFEAAACGAPIVSDGWEGLDRFFVPGREIAIARDTPDVLAALEMSDADLARQAKLARERTLAEHTSAHRAREMVRMIENAAVPQTVGAG